MRIPDGDVIGEDLENVPAMPLPREPHIDFVLGHVHVESDLVFFCDIRASRQRRFAECHERMKAEQCGDLVVTGITTFADEPQILVDALTLGIAVRDLVTEAAGEADITECLLDRVEAAVATGWRGVMIDDGRATGTSTLHECQQRGVVHVLGLEGLVELPPQFLQDFLEVRRRHAGRCEAACKGRVKVVMRIDEARHYDPALRIDDTVRFPVSCRCGADLDNVAVLDEHAARLDATVFGIERDDNAVVDSQRAHVIPRSPGA